MIKGRPFVKWAGGKRQIMNKLMEYVPDEFDTYYEPFVGGGALLFELSPKRAVINDSNYELKNVAINLKTAYKMNGKTLNYLDVYKFMPDKLKNALIYIYDLIDMDKIKDIIYDIDTLSDVMKDFYYKTILLRKSEIIDKYYKKN